MINLSQRTYEYQEEINPGIVNQFYQHENKQEKVLDVGCGSGKLGEAIKSKGYCVWGIELNIEAAKIAKTRLDNVIINDLLDTLSIKQDLDNVLFDHLVFSDVLEHLYDPFSILCEYTKFLRPGGRLYISVPNAVVWNNRLSILFGKFNYQPTGVMDRTHIRFFTYRSAIELIKAADYRIKKIDYTPMIVRAFLPIIKKIIYGKNEKNSIIESQGYLFYEKFIYPIEYVLGFLFKSFFAFRIIIVAEKRQTEVN